jgi:hypothetical protein
VIENAFDSTCDIFEDPDNPVARAENDSAPRQWFFTKLYPNHAPRGGENISIRGITLAKAQRSKGKKHEISELGDFAPCGRFSEFLFCVLCALCR